ncbi:MAG: histidine triad nucleotide-binding protein [Armatimonas sp.]
METIFSKIIAREIPAEIVYEDENILAFKDIAPQAPVHVLVIPKKYINNVLTLEADDAALAGELLLACGKVAKLMGIEEGGARVVFNCGVDGGQAVPHLHAHVLGGRKLGWPPG